MKHILILFLFLLTISTKGQVSDTIEVSYLYNTNIIFDEPLIRDPQFGSSVALTHSVPDKYTISLKADGTWMAREKKSSISNTNMNVRTESNLYNFIITYNKLPQKTTYTSNDYTPVYTYAEKESSTIEVTKAEEKEYATNETLEMLTFEPRDIFDVGSNASKFKMQMTVTNIWVDSANIYIKYIVENYSNVPYDIDYFRFVTTYKKWSFNRTTEPIDDHVPLMKLQNQPNATITRAEPYVDVIAFSKFTLNKREYLNIQLGESNGARLISVPVGQQDFLDAKVVPTSN